MSLAASEPNIRLSRRRVIVGGATVVSGALLGACTSTPPPQGTPLPRTEPVPLRSPAPTPEPTVQRHRAMYGTLYDGGFQVPAVPIERIDPRFYRQMVNDPTGEAPGTVVVDTSNHFLYLVERNGRAMRYGVGLGRAGFDWSGRGVIEWKQEWPRWFPPDEMIDRQPELEIYRARQVPGTNRWEGGMEAGLQNPLGARALYIFQDGRDTLYRIHGSPEWWSIGTSVSSGCVRMINQDVIDLYDRVPEQSPILVRSGGRFA
jgi:lipoprotein-anchoring transpeptidase ErfK/SrfK